MELLDRYLQAVKKNLPRKQRDEIIKFRFHDMRHTFGSLLIQAGVSPAYVQKQMGHKSIQVTIDTYGHLIPGENVAWIDHVDSKNLKTAPQKSANARGLWKYDFRIQFGKY
jgi:integrase